MYFKVMVERYKLLYYHKQICNKQSVFMTKGIPIDKHYTCTNAPKTVTAAKESIGFQTVHINRILVQNLQSIETKPNNDGW